MSKKPRAARPKTPRRQKTLSLKLDDLPNPATVSMIEKAVTAIADKSPSGPLREVMPLGLLSTALSLGAGNGSITFEDGPEIKVRKIDIEAAFIRMMGKFMTDVVTKVVRPSAIDAMFDEIDAPRVSEPADTSYPAIAVYKASGERVHGDDVPAGPRLRWVMFDNDNVATRFKTIGDAAAESDSLNFLAQQEESGEVFVAEIYQAPPTPVVTTRGDGSSAKRRRRRKSTAKQR